LGIVGYCLALTHARHLDAHIARDRSHGLWCVTREHLDLHALALQERDRLPNPGTQLLRQHHQPLGQQIRRWLLAGRIGKRARATSKRKHPPPPMLVRLSRLRERAHRDAPGRTAGKAWAIACRVMLRAEALAAISPNIARRSSAETPGAGITSTTLSAASVR